MPAPKYMSSPAAMFAFAKKNSDFMSGEKPGGWSDTAWKREQESALMLVVGRLHKVFKVAREQGSLRVYRALKLPKNDWSRHINFHCVGKYWSADIRELGDWGEDAEITGPEAGVLLVGDIDFGSIDWEASFFSWLAYQGNREIVAKPDGFIGVVGVGLQRAFNRWDIKNLPSAIRAHVSGEDADTWAEACDGSEIAPNAIESFDGLCACGGKKRRW